jgi:hypothetical protein
MKDDPTYVRLVEPIKFLVCKCGGWFVEGRAERWAPFDGNKVCACATPEAEPRRVTTVTTTLTEVKK